MGWDGMKFQFSVIPYLGCLLTVNSMMTCWCRGGGPFTYSVNGRKLQLKHMNDHLLARTGAGYEDLLQVLGRMPCDSSSGGGPRGSLTGCLIGGVPIGIGQGYGGSGYGPAAYQQQVDGGLASDGAGVDITAAAASAVSVAMYGNGLVAGEVNRGYEKQVSCWRVSEQPDEEEEAEAGDSWGDAVGKAGGQAATTSGVVYGESGSLRGGPTVAEVVGTVASSQQWDEEEEEEQVESKGAADPESFPLSSEACLTSSLLTPF